jgi:hypothetical protein
VALENRDGVPVPRQFMGRGNASNAGADDGDVHGQR